MMLRLDAEVYFVVMLGWCILRDFLFFVEWEFSAAEPTPEK